MTTENALSFTELDRRLREVPDGPAAILDSPPLFRIANVVGGFAAIMTVIPFVMMINVP